VTLQRELTLERGTIMDLDSVRSDHMLERSSSNPRRAARTRRSRHGVLQHGAPNPAPAR
jgi:hypothetical protein